MSADTSDSLKECCKFERVSHEFSPEEFALTHVENEWQKEGGESLAQFHELLLDTVVDNLL